MAQYTVTDETASSPLTSLPASENDSSNPFQAQPSASNWGHEHLEYLSIKLQENCLLYADSNNDNS